MSQFETYRGVGELEAAVGRELGPSAWLTVDQDRVDGFSEATGDDRWIHVDVERAARGPYGSTIVHNLLVLSLVPYFISTLRRIDGARLGLNYGLDRVRFPAPVRVGSRLRGRITVIEVTPIGTDAAQVLMRTTIEIEDGEKPCCVADSVSRIYF